MRPPVNRAMRTLDRAFFRRQIPIAAARIANNKDISSFRHRLQKSEDAFVMERLSSIRPDPNAEIAQKGQKCLLLRPGLKVDDPSTWSPTIQELVEQTKIKIIPYNLELDYDYWTYYDIISSVLPEDELDEIPSGFNVAGHIAHLNLRDHSLPYKHLIAQVILDKNPQIKTVINKIQNVGEENEYRTFAYEVLAGPDDLNVEIKEEECIFRFDYSKVYWNSRLNTEHHRLTELFKEGEAVCDVMAGVGPFAVPAGKKNAFVWANDLNPDSYSYLVDAIQRNKVWNFVQAFNEDGREFIRTATARLYAENSSRTVTLGEKPIKRMSKSVVKEANSPIPPAKVLHQPKTFSHFVMNLPATAITFLPSFIGLYSSLFPDYSTSSSNHPDLPLPMIHVHTFGLKPENKRDDNTEEEIRICEEVSKQLGTDIKRTDPEVIIHDVRDVAPKKRMFCASFRLPEEVAWRKV
ncbi:guanine-N(1)--methyltransferas-like protein [Rhizodiscina lignyota]|uniref:tRNA (guanine(37)-N1)-methyltransferase n=1 Tax=Rhizodiscina lignyota TaxID=1504668 RepID=A0A9P4IE02_9PEZI|nr:guanine-N(1)--methyltransferas-like protein [Rhizodiscina lignyota]